MINLVPKENCWVKQPTNQVQFESCANWKSNASDQLNYNKRIENFSGLIE